MIEQSIDDGEAYRIVLDGKKVGGVVIKVEGEKGDLDLLFVAPSVHSKGIGYAASVSYTHLIEESEVQIGELQSQIRSSHQEKISGDNIYLILLAVDEVYHCATEAEQKEFMQAFIERIEMFPEKRKDGSWIKKIVFNFPVPVDGEEVKELPLETETTVETVCLLSRKAQ